MRREVATEVLQAQANLGPRGGEGETLRPLDDEDGGGGEHVLHAERFEVVKGLDAVEVGVKDLGRPCRRTWTRVKVGLVTSSSLAAAETGDDAFVRVVFPVPRSPVEEDEDRRFEAGRKFPAPVGSFFRGMGDDFFRHAVAAPRQSDG